MPLVRVTAAKEVPLFPGAVVYRNQDVAFEKRLRAERAAERRVALRGGFTYEAGHARLWATDEEGLTAECCWQADYAAAEQAARMRETFLKQIRKVGELPFVWDTFEAGEIPFMPIAEINARRRALLSDLCEKRVNAHAAAGQPRAACSLPTDALSARPVAAPQGTAMLPPDENGRPQPVLDYRANVANTWAERFYRARGVGQITRGRQPGQWLMQCKYCIRYELGQCPRHFKRTDPDYQQDLYLIYKAHTFALRFDCAHERMEVYAVKNGREA